MLKKLFTLFLGLYAAIAMAAVDVNKASETQLVEIKGIGPATATRILDARKQGPFKNWDDLIVRVKGIAPTIASKLSEAGLTVNGQAFKPAPGSTPATANAPNATPPASKPSQPASKKQEKG